MKLDLDNLKRLAGEAAPGPWTSNHHDVADVDGIRVAEFDCTRGKYELEKANRDFIAEASPTTVSAMIELIERQEQELAAARKEAAATTRIKLIKPSGKLDDFAGAAAASIPAGPELTDAQPWNAATIAELAGAFGMGPRNAKAFAAKLISEIPRLAAPSVAPAPESQPADDDLLEVVRCLCSMAARRAELEPEKRKHYPHVDEEGSPLLAAARAACVARGYTEDGLAVEGVDYPVVAPVPAASEGVPSLADRAANCIRTGINYAASHIEKQAADYLRQNASTEPDTGATVFQYGEAGRDYHSTLVELAEEIRALAAPAAPATSDKAEGL